LTAENYWLSYKESIGGVAIGLGAVSQHFHPLWIGAINLPREEIEDERESIEEELLKKHNCLPVFLSRDEIEGYYNGFSNSVLWPLFHGLLDCYKFPVEWWEQYKAVNRKFLDKIIDVAKPDDILWINDYHFLLLPGMIRREMRQHKIGFFLHIAFPEPHIFDRVPFRDELLNQTTQHWHTGRSHKRVAEVSSYTRLRSRRRPSGLDDNRANECLDPDRD
jgi:trehalose 6-phosphate synthase/phosphatase